MDQFVVVVWAVLGSSVGAAVGNFSLTGFRAWRKQLRDTRYLAMKTAFILERYAIECADAVSNHDLALQSSGHAGKVVTAVIELSELPKEEGFEHLDPKLLNSILEISARVLLAQREASVMSEVAEYEDAQQVAFNRTAELGFAAIELASALRSAHKVPQRSMVFDRWDIKETLASNR